MMLELHQPLQADRKTRHANESDLREYVAKLLHVPSSDLVSYSYYNGEDEVTLWYASQAECDADLDGSYALNSIEVESE